MEESSYAEYEFSEPYTGEELQLKNEMFDDLLKYSSERGYNFHQFKEICQKGHKMGTECEKVWLSLINVAKFFIHSGKKSPAEAVIWFIETAFPTASILRTESYILQEPLLPIRLRGKIMRETGHRARISEEKKKEKLFNELLHKELGL